jgi:dienelactone hydrolase
MFPTRFLLIALLAGFCFLPAPGQPATNAQTPGERMAAEYFRQQTARIAARTLTRVHTLADWQAKRATYRQQLLEMLGLAPLPPKGDLKATITGKVETEKFTVEKIHFQSLPGLYVTANLYLPKTRTGPAPTVLYLCGHLRTVKDGIAYGTKVGYQHHPAWLAEHGYVALIIDTLEMGEIEGEHHGTHRRGMWWWPTRGYTPAGVETWNAMRALDYLATRPEVDMQRVGVTGRSGGGAYTWFLAAVDDRPSVLIPVAGVTDMTNHVVGGCIEGHCDCMFQLNTYGWDFSLLAALAAPRPLLLSNSDKDRIFPLDGVQRIHRDVQRIYKLHNAEDKLGLLITEGPHSDTQDLQVPAFRWLNRWLKKETGLLSEPALKRFEAEQLKVFTALPADQINTRIHELFVPAAPAPALPSTRQEWQTLAARWSAALREKVFNNWPATNPRPAAKFISDKTLNNVRARLIEFQPDDAYRLQLALLTNSRQAPAKLAVHVLDEEQWRQWAAVGGQYFPTLFASENNNGVAEADWLKPLQQGTAIALVLPRGVGPTAWRKEKETHIRRRFLLLGQSLETMQVWDARAALATLREIPSIGRLPVSLHGARTMSVVALFAALFENGVTRLELERLPATLANGPSFPNVLRFFDLPQLVALALPRAVNLTSADPGDWEWSLKAAKLLEGTITFSKDKTTPVDGAEGVQVGDARQALLKRLERPRAPLRAQATILEDPETKLTRWAFSFDSEANERVPGLLVKQTNAVGRRPVVIALHGTGGNKEGQLPLLNELAERGFIAVAIDGRYHGARIPSGKGSKEYVDAMLQTWRTGKGRPFLYDTVWDVMRLLDYLATRPDVDASRIGVIGFSKGGMETYIAAALDERIAVAVPCIGVQSFRYALDHESWQSRAGTFQAALDGAAKDAGAPVGAAFLRKFYDRVAPEIYGEFDGPQTLPLIAPRPLLVINGDSDARTPLAGVEECATRARTAYAKANAAEKFALHIQPKTGHAVTSQARQLAMEWFVRWLKP